MKYWRKKKGAKTDVLLSNCLGKHFRALTLVRDLNSISKLYICPVKIKLRALSIWFSKFFTSKRYLGQAITGTSETINRLQQYRQAHISIILIDIFSLVFLSWTCSIFLLLKKGLLHYVCVCVSLVCLHPRRVCMVEKENKNSSFSCHPHCVCVCCSVEIKPNQTDKLFMSWDKTRVFNISTKGTYI